MLDLGGPLPSPQASLLGLSEGPLTLQSDSKSRSHLCFLSPFEPHPQHHVSPPCLPAFSVAYQESTQREPLTLS